ncbi:MAG: hypothetical protein ACW980_21800 [Promethearchaeota archaeon]|jgi:hypothetical protein
MGLSKSNNRGKIYLNLVGGKIARRHQSHIKDVDGKNITIDRDIFNDKKELVKTVIEEYYDELSGLLQDAKLDTTGDYGSRLILELIDEGELFSIQIPVNTSYGRSFLMRVPNIDSSVELTIKPYSFEDKEKGKKISGINIFQSGCGWENNKVPNKWSKDNPGDLPSWEKEMVAGKVTWNSNKQLNYLVAEFENWCKNIASISIIDTSVNNEVDPLELERQFAEEKMSKDSSDNQGGQSDLPF